MEDTFENLSEWLSPTESKIPVIYLHAKDNWSGEHRFKSKLYLKYESTEKERQMWRMEM